MNDVMNRLIDTFYLSLAAAIYIGLWVGLIRWGIALRREWREDEERIKKAKNGPDPDPETG
jgi:hypothetical protein